MLWDAVKDGVKDEDVGGKIVMNVPEKKFALSKNCKFENSGCHSIQLPNS